MDSPDIPTPPDPAKTAAAQTASNKETAISNANLNRVDQYTPFGSSTYKITGTNPDGTPKYEQTTAFSAPVQGLFDSNMAMSQGLANTGVSQLQQLQQQYSMPFSLNTDVENRINQIQSARLEPQLAQQEDALRTRLTNQGIREGTDAWDRALKRNGEMATDARDNFWLRARQQGVNEALTQRNQPLMEFNSIRTGTAPNMPTFTNVPNTQMANTNVAGIYDSAYQNQVAAAKMEADANNAFMGGLFGLGGTLGGAWLRSDIRLKRDIKRVGSLPSGLPLYSFRYLWSDAPHIGVMAQEARELFPEAVAEIDGYLSVDYSRIG